MTQFFSRHSLKILFGLAFLIPLFMTAVRHTGSSNSVETWLPSHSAEARTFDWYKEHFGSDESLLASWDGSTLDDPRVEFFARRLEKLPEIARCQTPGGLIEAMGSAGVPREEAIGRLEGLLVGPGGTETPKNGLV